MKLPFAFACLLCAVSLSARAAISVPPELPVETIFQTPSLTSLSFSPNGKYIACLVPY